MLKTVFISCGLVLSESNCMCQLNERRGDALSIKGLFFCALSSWSLNSPLCVKCNGLTVVFFSRMVSWSYGE